MTPSTPPPVAAKPVKDKPAKDKPTKPAAKGKYMVLRGREDGEWSELGWFDAPEHKAKRSAILATPDLKQTLEQGEQVPLVAVAARSWKPRAASSEKRDPVLKV